MSDSVNDNQQQIAALEVENRRLRQQLRELQQQLKQQADSLEDCQEALDTLPRQQSESERLLRLAIDNIPQAVFWKDRHSIFLGCNECFSRLAGFKSPKEIIGKTDYDMPWTREESEFFIECDRQVMESDTPELGIIEPQQQVDGSQHWLETNKIPLHDDRGNVIGILGTFIDVTQRQQTKLELQQLNEELEARVEERTQKLQATESRLQHLAANLPGVIFQFRLDPDGTQSFPYVSQRSRAIYEVEPENFSQVFDLVHPEDIERLYAAIQESALTLNRFDCEYRIITPSGVLKWLHAMSQPERQGDGEIIWDGIIIDISDRKRIEKEQQRLLAILENTPDIIGIADDCGNNLYLNRAGQEFLEIPPEECDSYNISECHPPEIAQKLATEAIPTAIRTGMWKGESCLCSRSGHKISVSQVILAHKDDNGELEFVSIIMRDISDRLAIEAALSASEERFRLVCEQTGQLVYEYDIASGQIIWAGAIAAITGYSAEEFQRFDVNDWENLIHLDDRDRVTAYLERTMAEGAPYCVEYRWRQKEGNYIEVEDIGVFLTGENGQVSRMLGTTSNISDRKAAEQALAESEAFNRYLFEEFPIGLLLCRLDGQMIQANSTYAKIIGRTIPETLELTYWQITPEKYADLEAQQLQSLQTTGRYGPYEKEYIHKDGHLVPVVLSGLIVERNGESFIWSSIADISDRKAAEERLRQQEAQYRQVFETISDGLGIVDLERGNLVEVNPAYHQIHGYSYEEFLALPYTDIVHPDSHALLAQFIADVREGRVFTCQAQNVHRNGRIVDIEVKGIPFPYQGKPHALVLVRDISEKVKLERDRARQEQALRSTVEGTAAQTGEEFFRACVKSLAFALEVPYVLVAEIEPRDESVWANVVAFWMDTDFGETFQYDLSDTPCCNVLQGGEICRYPDSVQTLFPDDPYLAPIGAESYVGIPLVDSRGTVVGLIAILHTQPIAEASEMQASILEIFAARAGAEIERMRSDKALREKDRILQLTLKAGKLGCWSLNSTTNEVIWSDGVEEILGLPANSFGGTFEDYLSLVHPEDLEVFQRSVEQALATEREYNTEHRLVLPDGRIQWIRGRGEIWRDEKGNTIGLLGSVLNETQRKMAEIALIESTEQIQKQALQDQLLNQIANQIRISLDLDRILETMVQEIHDFMQVDRCHFAWYLQESDIAYWHVIAEVQNPNVPSFVGKHPVANFGPLSELLLREEILKLDDTATIDNPTLQETLTALGNKSMLVLPVNSESGKFGIIACIHHQAVRPWRDEEVEFLEAIVAQVAIAINQADLFAQSQFRAQELEELLGKFQRTQTQLIQSEKMSSLGQMVAGVAHEINNPVGFIHGNLVHAREYMEDLLGLFDLYQHHYPQPHLDICDEIEAIDLDFLKGDLQKLFQSMSVGTSRIQEIVKSLRTFSRLDEAEVKDVDLHDGIDSTLMILQTRLRAQDWRPAIKVIKEYGDLPRVQCYAGQLNQVFMNILSNAIDALEERDRHKRTLTQMKKNKSQIRIQTVKQDNNIVIRISDNGNGMSEETRNKLFDPFFTTKAVGKGTGLGLSISYQIVTEKHKGKLYCTSQPGKTTFTIQIPAIAE